jgi:uncharacterized protein (DUF983 family)
MKDEKPHRSYLAATLGCYCPRCREGKLFRHHTSIRVQKNMDMYELCPVCGQPTDIEVGFYYGTSYISYLVSIAITVVYFLLWWLIIGFSFTDKRFLYWVVSNAILLLVLQPWLMRFSRSLWISFFVHYDPDWNIHPPETLERINKNEMNNW